MAISKHDLDTHLAAFIEPNMGVDLLSAGCVKNTEIGADKVHLEIEMGFPIAGYEDSLKAGINEALANALDGVPLEIELSSKITAHAVQTGAKRMPTVKNTLAIASGKGGVGKSTTTTNLALALRDAGATVGVLDADIYGPSQPRMLGAHGKPESRDGKSMEPKVTFGIQSMSIGNLIDEDTPMIWRGPMATGALEQMINDTNWQDLDYLLIDLPPGTGDIQLTLSQKIPLSGALIVTTPQDIALLDAKKALKMFEKVDVPVLGIVENMSVHICSNCGHEEHIFGAGGGQSMAQQYDVDLLGSLPLSMDIREGVDAGKPTVAFDPESRSSEIYRQIARRVAGKLAIRAKDYSAKFPNIVVQQT
ncbi:MAG: iron-sulfur cluster carrier protein ApbC [Gammaproteobacteria bacterium]